MSAGRVAGRARFAAFLHDYIRGAALRGETLMPAWAARWEISRQKVARWCDPTVTEAAVACGDFEALDDADLAGVLRAWLEAVEARLEEPTPVQDVVALALAIVVRAGRIAETVEALMLRARPHDPDALAALERDLAEHERNARAARLAVRAARLAAEGRPWSPRGPR